MGEFLEGRRDWREAPDKHCELCGRLLPGRFWSAEVEGRAVRLCDSDCEEVYREYWLPRYDAVEAAS